LQHFQAATNLLSNNHDQTDEDWTEYLKNSNCINYCIDNMHAAIANNSNDTRTIVHHSLIAYPTLSKNGLSALGFARARLPETAFIKPLVGLLVATCTTMLFMTVTPLAVLFYRSTDKSIVVAIPTIIISSLLYLGIAPKGLQNPYKALDNCVGYWVNCLLRQEDSAIANNR
jgi:hypothetical protein